MKAATPPFFWAFATACSAIVVLPLDSGPNSSMIRPFGSPIPPSARSSEIAPVEIPSTSSVEPSPSFMIAPAPNALSIELIAWFKALSLAVSRWALPFVSTACFLATACSPSSRPQESVR